MKIIFFILIIITSLFSTEKKINIKTVDIHDTPISNANVYLLKDSKIDGICVIGAVCHTDNPEDSSSKLLKAFQYV